jgi:magnesium chelatase family protein
MNPCRCGYLGDAARACGKAPKCAVEYQSKISGPLLDRIDIHIEVAAMDTLSMIDTQAAEPSAEVAKRVARARVMQLARYQPIDAALRVNASVSGDLLQQVAMPQGRARQLLEEATNHLRLSMRGLTRVLRVARTVADLEGCEEVKEQHLAEALSYRQVGNAAHAQAA